MFRSADTQKVLLKARYAFAVAQLELRQLLILRTRKQFNPNQPRVPAGNYDGGQWTDGGGGAPPARTMLSSNRAVSQPETGSLVVGRIPSHQRKKHVWT